MYRSIAVLAVLLGVLLAPAAGPAATQERNPKPALDLPAMALFPADLEAEGLNGYAIGVGNLTPWEYEARFISQALGLDDGDVVNQFQDAGTSRVFKQFLDLRDDPEDWSSPIRRTVLSYVYAGSDEVGAERLFELLAVGATATAREALDAPAVGDAAVLTSDEGMDPYTGQLNAAWLRLDMRSGSDIVGAVIIDYAGSRPDPTPAAALAERLLERVDSVRGGDSPGLFSLTLQLQWDDEVDYPGPIYLQIEGESQVVGAADSGIGKQVETAVDNRARAAFFDRIGAVDVYFSHQYLRAPTDDGRHRYHFEVVLIHFEDQQAAEDYMADLPDHYAGADEVSELSEVTDLPDAGDEALGFAYRMDHGGSMGGELVHHAAYIRAGDLVARVDVMGVTALDEEGVAVIAEAQARCLADGGCAGLFIVPDELRFQKE